MIARAIDVIASHISRIGARFRVVVMTFRPDLAAPFLRLTGAMLLILPRILSAQSPARVVVEAGVETPIWASSRTGFLGGGPQLDIPTRFVATLGAMTFSEGKKSALGLVGSYVGSAKLPGRRLELRYRRWQQDGAGWHASGGLARSAFTDVSNSGGRWNVSGITGSFGIDRGWIGIDARLDLLGADRTHGDYQALVQLVTIGGRLARPLDR